MAGTVGTVAHDRDGDQEGWSHLQWGSYKWSALRAWTKKAKTHMKRNKESVEDPDG